MYVCVCVRPYMCGSNIVEYRNIYIYICVCVCVYVCMCMCVCLCVCRKGNLMRIVSETAEGVIEDIKQARSHVEKMWDSGTQI